MRPAATIRARQDLGEDIEFTLDLARAEEHPAKALDTALRLAQKLAERDERRVVVFFDEFQDIGTGRFGDGDTITRKMRAVFQRSPEVSVLFAGSIEHLMRNLFAPGERALSHFGSFHQLTAITSEEWGEGIRERLARDQTSVTGDALSRLVELGEGRPQHDADRSAGARPDDLRNCFREEIDHAAVVAALDRAMASEQLRHQQQLERIRAAGRFAERMAIRVAADAELYRNLKPQQASRALNALRDIGVVERVRQGRWYVIDPMLRRYLAGRRVEPLSFTRNAFDVVEVFDDVSRSPGESTTGR